MGWFWKGPGRGRYWVGVLRWMHGFVAEVQVVHGMGRGLLYRWRFWRFDRAVRVGAEWCMDGGCDLRVVGVGR